MRRRRTAPIPRARLAPLPGWTPHLEAIARARLCEAFLTLTQHHFLPVVSAAAVLRLSPSAVSGQASMLRRYQEHGADSLKPRNRPPQTSRVAAAARPLLEGNDLVYEGQCIASAVAFLQPPSPRQP